MIDEPLAESYFKWLYREVAPARQKNPARTYWSLLRQLHEKEFVWFVPNDDNRVADGKFLREGFLESINDVPHNHPLLMEAGCTMLEMLIALSRRLAFNGGQAASEWFWHMLDNVGLRGFNDGVYKPEDEEETHKFMAIEDILDRVISRTYEYDGSGGLFPLREPHVDQTQVEIWDQMNKYLIERG